MKALFFSVAVFVASSLQAQSPKTAASGVTYGSGTTAEASIPVTELPAKMNGSSFSGKITATVTEVCKEKGCWMKIRREGGDDIMVKFRDYGFFMPQNIVGQTVVLEGVANVKETSVEQLRHYAMDAGQSKAQIRKIKKPKKDIQFVASGVLVK